MNVLPETSEIPTEALTDLKAPSSNGNVYGKGISSPLNARVLGEDGVRIVVKVAIRIDAHLLSHLSVSVLQLGQCSSQPFSADS